ncbi:MAG: tRNA (adenosine(37)-N6)-threonylcarbamoyltransferase complex ATPase subunit type 1 TsaE [Clostridiales bacterium]|jgi:tRNA threonylcarbamoyladenosine biosynthesis protein TsaE|nr:tRNA (adenosine(37)-N6)-threonylcarbamoyltransferase complex ATPase subunit type 1 TsaE [Clostridiales bacterium]
MLQIVTKSEKETENLGRELAAKLGPQSIVALYGDLGAGKTAFVRGLARGLGIKKKVLSPTFTIVNELSENGKTLIHFDMYRLSGSDELFDIGWEDYLQRDCIIAVEWSEIVDDIYTGEEIRIRIEKLGDNERRISFGGNIDADFSL